jgi:hypothetical protein
LRFGGKRSAAGVLGLGGLWSGVDLEAYPQNVNTNSKPSELRITDMRNASGVEVALWGLAGKAYGVPCYAMLGGKFRDRARIYCDTTESRDPKVFAQRRLPSPKRWLSVYPHEGHSG